jgi:rubrerythrin
MRVKTGNAQWRSLISADSATTQRGKAMQSERLNEIIDFAIARENEAVQFYQKLQQMAAFSEKKKLFQQFESMERGHIVILEGIKKMDIRHIDVPEVETLHISDYLVDAPESKPDKLSYQDILILAMKKEQRAHELYKDLAEKNKDPDVVKLFSRLASEEARHKRAFEEMYDGEILNQY